MCFTPLHLKILKSLPWSQSQLWNSLFLKTALVLYISRIVWKSVIKYIYLLYRVKTNKLMGNWFLPQSLTNSKLQSFREILAFCNPVRKLSKKMESVLTSIASNEKKKRPKIRQIGFNFTLNSKKWGEQKSFLNFFLEKHVFSKWYT